jgi:Putative beta-barrel porin 2
MRGGILDRILPLLRAALGTFFLLGCITVAAAQQQPPEIPLSNVLTTPSDVLSYNGWLFYPEITAYAVGTDNLFQTSTSPIGVGGAGYKPKLITEWTDGIHTTTLYGNLDQRFYPSRSDLNTFDRNGGFIQQYSPLPDLNFKLQGDYTHVTNTGVVGAIPGTLVSAGSPSPGVQANPTLTVQATGVSVNPTDTWSAAASVQKLFNHGVVNLTGTLAQTTYTDQSTQILAGTPNYTQETFAGNGATWLGPLFYLFSDGTYSAHNAAQINASPGDNSIAYRARGGIATRQEALFSAAAYYGYQGSNDEFAGRAGGEIYGGSLSYYPTAQLSFTAAIDETINKATAGGVSNLALSLPTSTAAVVTTSSSTKITAPTLQVAYHITDQWATFGTFGLAHIDFIGSSQIENAWLADVVLRYDMSRSWTFSWEYQYTAIISNVPLSSSTRNYVYTAATYKF